MMNIKNVFFASKIQSKSTVKKTVSNAINAHLAIRPFRPKNYLIQAKFGTIIPLESRHYKELAESYQCSIRTIQRGIVDKRLVKVG